MIQIVPKQFIKLSRNLRREQTPWEAKLWYYLRNKRFCGLKFKRQFRMGDYIVDFYCASKKLVIELDGGQHNEKLIESEDRKRTEYLTKQGYKVLRFWNNDVEQNIEGVLETIRREILK